MATNYIDYEKLYNAQGALRNQIDDILDLIAEIKNSVERCDPRIEITEVEFESFDNVSGELILNLHYFKIFKTL